VTDWPSRLRPGNLVVVHPTREELEAGLAGVRRSPAGSGRLELIVRRPGVDGRESVAEAELDRDEGLVGDGWRVRGSRRTPDGAAHRGRQVTVMNSRLAALVAGTEERWALAGDQLYVDLDLSGDNLPPGTRLAVGEAVLEVSDQPHLGCEKFAARFGREALHFVNSATGRALNLRGVNTSVVVSGTVRVGDTVTKVVPVR
jgi:hypothetical protein